jgi:glycosyltransferase involved in cell wall biosynthesis
VAPLRLAQLVSHPIPYKAPLYRELARRPEIDLTVHFYSDASVRGYHDLEFGREVQWDTPLLDGYRSRFAPSAARNGAPGKYGSPPRLDVVRDVLAGRYDVVWMNSYADGNAWLVAAAELARRSRVLIREEQTLLHPRPWYKAALKEVALRALFSRTWGLYIGEQSRQHFLHYGMPEGRLFPSRYCVDNDFFQRKGEELRPRTAELRAGFGIESEAPVVLCVAKTIPKKAPLVLIEAFAQLRARRPCSLLMVGEGELLPAARALVEERRIPDVHFAGFLNQTEVPAAYVAADVFCLPSLFHETWGLVVNEALNFSLPVVVSDKVGCGVDLVQPGKSGFVVPAGEAAPLAESLEVLVAHEELRRSFGRKGFARVNEYSIEACADGIVEACVAGR